MKYLTVALVTVFLAGCSLFGSNSSSDLNQLWITNESEARIYVGLLEETVLHLIDPIPSFDQEDAPFPAIESGSTRRFKISEIEGFSSEDNLGILVYILADLTLGPLPQEPRGVFSTVTIVGNDELIENKGHIVIDLD